MKKVLVQFNIPGWTAKQYDAVWADLRAAGYSNPKGLLWHGGGAYGNNWLVSDVWESEEDFNKFGEVLLPFLAKHGAPQVPPAIAPLYYEYVGTATGTPR